MSAVCCDALCVGGSFWFTWLVTSGTGACNPGCSAGHASLQLCCGVAWRDRRCGKDILATLTKTENFTCYILSLCGVFLFVALVAVLGVLGRVLSVLWCWVCAVVVLLACLWFLRLCACWWVCVVLSVAVAVLWCLCFAVRGCCVYVRAGVFLLCCL